MQLGVDLEVARTSVAELVSVVAFGVFILLPRLDAAIKKYGA